MRAIHSYSTLAMRDLLSRAAFMESFSKSGFYLKILISFFVDSFKMAVMLAISNYTSSNYFLFTIPTRVILLLTSSEYLSSFVYCSLRSLLISNPASSELISFSTLSRSKNFKDLMAQSRSTLSLKLSVVLKFISYINIKGF